MTSSGTPVFKNSGGKLGAKCLDLNTRVNFNCDALANLENFSIAFWAKVNSDTTQSTNWVDVIGFTDVNRSSGSTGQLRWETCYASGYESRGISSHNNANDSIGTGFGAIIGANKNTWYHIALVVDYTNGTIKQYCDGIVVSTPTPTGGHLNGAFWLGESGKINGEIQDVRIYNNCLTPEEVKRIAQGLVLHYPLNNGGFGAENLILESKFVTGGGAANGITRSYASDGSLKVVATSGNGNYCSVNFAKDSNSNVGAKLTIGDTYTISCKCKIESGTALPTLFINSGNAYKQLNGDKTLNQWHTISYTSTWADPGSGYGNIALHLGFSGAIGTYYFKEFKLEKSPSVTPWCPAPGDANNLGVNSTTEYDISGFCNNGTRTGTFNWTSDTPKYCVSTTLGSTSTKIHISNLTTSGFGNSYSFAWWGKTPTWSGMMQWGFSDGVRLNGIYNGNLWNTGDGSNNPIYKPGTTTQITVPSVNVWHHYVMTGDGTTNKLYVDGELYGTSKTYKGISGTSIYLNGWDSSTTYCHSSYQMSDFRIYATALSATDVKSLYQNCATIGPDGTIYGKIR